MGYVDGAHLYQYSMGTPIAGGDPTGLACQVFFECRLFLFGYDDPDDPSQKFCHYSCCEVRRRGITRPGGQVACDPDQGIWAPPQDICYADTKVVDANQPCPGRYTDSVIFDDTYFTKSCDKQKCYQACQDGSDIAEFICRRFRGPLKLACKAIVAAAHLDCVSCCDAFCKRQWAAIGAFDQLEFDDPTGGFN